MSKRNYEQEYVNIMDGLSESVLEMTDDEIAEEITAEGGDPQEVAERTKAVMMEVVKGFQYVNTVLDELLNDVVLDIYPLSIANGSINATSQRQLASDIADHITKAKRQIAARLAVCKSCKKGNRK